MAEDSKSGKGPEKDTKMPTGWVFKMEMHLGLCKGDTDVYIYILLMQEDMGVYRLYAGIKGLRCVCVCASTECMHHTCLDPQSLCCMGYMYYKTTYT